MHSNRNYNVHFSFSVGGLVRCSACTKTYGSYMKTQTTIVSCDKCKAKDVTGTRDFFLHTGWLSDPAGGSSQQDGHTIDLCPKCMASYLQSYFNNITFDEAKVIINNTKFMKSTKIELGKPCKCF
jgi:DnaJ-class molecular chaperone